MTAVWPGSPAAKAGWKTDDTIIAVDGHAVETQTQLRFQTAPHYAGDELRVTLRRGKGDDAETIESTVTLADELPAFRHAFLGVLPQRTASETGAVVRAPWPGSPAAKSDLQPGDRITRLGDDDIASIKDAIAALNARHPGEKLKVIAMRGEEKVELEIDLGELPTDVLSADDLPSAPGASDAERAAPSAELKLEELKIPEFSQIARYYQPAGEGAPLGVLLWLADGDLKHNETLAAAWREVCDRDRLALVMPAPADAKGWSSDDLEFLGRILGAAITKFDADPTRIVVAGEGKAGQLAYVLAFKGRKTVRGVAVVDSPLPRTLKLPQNAPGQRLAVLSVESQNAPLTMLIRRDLKKISDAGYPASTLVRREAPNPDGQVDPVTQAAIARWIDALDRF